MNKIINYIKKYNQRSIALNIFDYGISIWLIIYCYTSYYSLKNIIFSTNNICSSPKSFFPFNIDIILYNLFSYNFFIPSIIILLLLAISLLFYSNIFNKFLIWFIFINLYTICASAIDGADTIFSNIMFIYMFCPKNPKNNKLIEDITNYHNQNHFPLISCLCITKNSENLVNLSIDCFRKQIYANKELIVVYEDDNTYINKIGRAHV